MSAQMGIPVGQRLIHKEANTKDITINNNRQHAIFFVWMMNDHTENASIIIPGN